MILATFEITTKPSYHVEITYTGQEFRIYDLQYDIYTNISRISVLSKLRPI